MIVSQVCTWAGTTVGTFVGDAVGPGAAVGAFVGAAVGLGAAVGTFVGAAVALGAAVGTFVGAAVALGAAVGTFVDAAAPGDSAALGVAAALELPFDVSAVLSARVVSLPVLSDALFSVACPDLLSVFSNRLLVALHLLPAAADPETASSPAAELPETLRSDTDSN